MEISRILPVPNLDAGTALYIVTDVLPSLRLLVAPALWVRMKHVTALCRRTKDSLNGWSMLEPGIVTQCNASVWFGSKADISHHYPYGYGPLIVLVAG